MGNAIERLAESNFMKKLQEISQKLTTNEIFATISGGMGATMGLIMIGAVIQASLRILVPCLDGSQFFYKLVFSV